jgi:fatty-acyl-CoA synthase
MVTYTPVEEPWRSQVVDAERLLHDGLATPPGVGARTIEVVSCGRPIADHQLRIVDEGGRPLPDGQVGEIEWQGPCVTAGYFAAPETTARSYVDERLRTGDLGYIADGRLFITGRKRDLVIVHGRNYAPQTIEWALDGLPLVRPGNAVAFAYPDEHGLEQIAIVCESAATDVAAVQRAVKRRVSDELALTVSTVVVLKPGKLPKTSSGKVRRADTRYLFMHGRLDRLGARRTGLDRALRTARLRWQAAVGSLRYRLRNGRRPRRRRTTEAP